MAFGSRLVALASKAAKQVAAALARAAGRVGSAAAGLASAATRPPVVAPPTRPSRVRPARAPVQPQRPMARPMQVEPEEDPNEPWSAVGGRRDRRRTTDIDRVDQGRRERVNNNDPLFTGEMIPVTSSNVHSIGFLLEGVEQGQPSRGAILHTLKGTLLVRYLATRGDGIRSGPGPLYEYQDVPATLFMDFQRAPSKGIWVWDHLRVRGTVTGHRYGYDFAGSEDSNIPRQAALRRGQTGQHFIRRTFLGHQSQLGDQRVNDIGPNPERGATRGGVRGQNQGTNRGGSQGLRFVRGSGRSR